MSKNSKSEVVLNKVIFSHQEIIDAIKKYAQFLNKQYKDKELVVIIILNGGFLFASYLIHYLNKLNLVIDFISISTYYKNQQKKSIHFYKNLKIDITNKHVLVLDDIIDTGKTTNLLYDFLKTLNPGDIQFTSLVLCKKSPLPVKTPLSLSVKGLLLLTYNYWIVGFGIDYQEKFRQLKDIYCLKWSKSKKPILTK